MVNVIGVRFQNAGKLYFFDPGELWPTPGDYVIVETTRGIELGEVVTNVHETDDSLLSTPLKRVIRVATNEDVRHNKENHEAEKEAFAICQRKISDHQLDMKLVGVEYTFDNSKILFYFTANGRVDFRSLVKDLAFVFHTRIELRQIGVRDEAKMLGGLGPCGRPICCGSFLGDFQPVSIKMAKEQNLSLNPTKISGVCGRLMCCLKYEEDHYEQTRRRMPRVGKSVTTPDGPGTVTDLNVIKETVRVRITKGDSFELKDYPLESLSGFKNACCCPFRDKEQNPEEKEAESTSELHDEANLNSDDESTNEQTPNAEQLSQERETRKNEQTQSQGRVKQNNISKRNVNAKGNVAQKHFGTARKEESKNNDSRGDLPSGNNRKDKAKTAKTTNEKNSHSISPSSMAVNKDEKPQKQSNTNTVRSSWKEAVENAMQAAQQQKS